MLARGEDKAFLALQAKAFGISSKLISISQALRIHEEQQIGNNVPSHVVLAFAIRHNLWITSEYSGQERGLIASIIGRKDKITHENLQRLGKIRGFVEAGWNNAYLDKDELSPKFVTAMENAKRIYFSDFSSLRQKVYDAALTADYPVTAIEWFDSATSGIKVLLKPKILPGRIFLANLIMR